MHSTPCVSFVSGSMSVLAAATHLVSIPQPCRPGVRSLGMSGTPQRGQVALGLEI